MQGLPGERIEAAAAAAAATTKLGQGLVSARTSFGWANASSRAISLLRWKRKNNKEVPRGFRSTKPKLTERWERAEKQNKKAKWVKFAFLRQDLNDGTFP
jgi:hypothetical protein